MTRIIQTFADPVIIPQGGMIAEIINWEATVPSGETFPFRIYSVYGNDIDGTPENFQFVLPNYMEEDVLTGPLVDSLRSTTVTSQIEVDAPIGTYDCLTMIGSDDGTIVTIMDFTIDLGILIIESGLGAAIIATEFFKV